MVEPDVDPSLEASEKNMEKAIIMIKMDRDMKENGKMVRRMEMEY